MKKFLSKIVICFTFCAILLVPMLSMAAYQPEPITFDPDADIQEGTQLGNVGPVDTAANIINWALGILGLFFLVLLLYGGYVWMIARGNEEEVGKDKKIIMSAVIGLVIILTSYGVTYYVFENLVNSTSR